MASPIRNGKIGTAYKKQGRHWSKGYHTGVDYPVSVGTQVYAVADGEIVPANWGKAYGVQVVQKLPDGSFWIYAHLSKTQVKAGAKVKAGDKIGLTGNTGNSTGPHLHCERRDNIRWSKGKDLDPMVVLLDKLEKPVEKHTEPVKATPEPKKKAAK